MTQPKIAEIIPLKNHIDKGFHYIIPPRFVDYAEIGKTVRIPFKNKEIVGVIVKILNKTDITKLKEVGEIIDSVLLLPEETLVLVNWVSQYYICPRGTVLNYIIPTKASRKKVEHYIKEETIICNQYNDFLVKNNISRVNKHQFLLFDNNTYRQDDLSCKPVLFHYHSKKIRDHYYNLLIRETISKGKQVLFLVPDQYSCIELKKRLKKNYGSIVGLFDKKVNQTQKYLRFLKTQSGSTMVVVGTRSNIFLPFRDIGLIIVEEENSSLYKEERAPRYNARDVALARGRIKSCKVILGSFSPSVESYWGKTKKEYLFKTEKRVQDYHSKFPEIKIINLEEEKSFQKIISFQLQQKIINQLKDNKKVVLFINRRGFSGYMVCSQCGYVIKCPECNYPLSYHVEKGKEMTICHICRKKGEIINNCPQCRKGKIRMLGIGVQHVESLISRMFPKMMIRRLDIDSAPKMVVQKKIVRKFNRGEIDILVGTQIIFRELDYQQVGLLGFILIDQMLNIPNYQSAENTFQFIYQAGLKMVEKNNTKSIYIQTYQPNHHALEAIRILNYPSFFEHEIINRKELDYPPIAKMIKIDFLGKDRDKVKKSVFHFIDYLQKRGIMDKYQLNSQISKNNLTILQEKNINKATYILRVKPCGGNISSLKSELSQCIFKFSSNDVKLMIDVDPVRM